MISTIMCKHLAILLLVSAFFDRTQGGIQQKKYIIMASGWPKKAETCRRITKCVYIIVYIYIAVVDNIYYGFETWSLILRGGT